MLNKFVFVLKFPKSRESDIVYKQYLFLYFFDDYVSGILPPREKSLSTTCPKFDIRSQKYQVFKIGTQYVINPDWLQRMLKMK